MAAAPCVSGAVHAQTAGPASGATLLGDWWTTGFNARVRIEACGDAVCGRIVWAGDEQPKDFVDKRSLVGTKVIDGMQQPLPASDAGLMLRRCRRQLRS